MIDSIIAAEGMGLLVSCVILYANHYETHQKNQKQKAFGVLMMLHLVGMLADMISWLVDGLIGFRTLNFIMTLISMVMVFAIAAVFILYIYIYISEKRKVSNKMFKILIWTGLIACVVFTIVGLKGGLFTLENNRYAEGKYYDIYLALNAAIVLVAAGLMIQSYKYLGRHDTLAATTFIVLPVISMGANAVNEEFSMIYPAITISVLITYVVMQAEHENRLIRREEDTNRKVNHDDLTGLLNRRPYVELVDRLAGEHGQVGIIFTDMNGLKYTNDNKGHEAGDQLICGYANLLLENFRKDDVFRISGDEFVVVLPNISQLVVDMREEALKKSIAGMEMPVAAVGSAFGEKKEIEQLIRDAEKAMYEDKQEFYRVHPQYRR